MGLRQECSPLRRNVPGPRGSVKTPDTACMPDRPRHIPATTPSVARIRSGESELRQLVEMPPEQVRAVYATKKAVDGELV